MVNFWNNILELVFPRRCLGCRILLDSGDRTAYVCADCLAGICLRDGFACAFCGAPVVAGRTCVFCLRAGHWLDRLWVAVSYEDLLIEKMLKSLKYRFVKTLAEDVAGLMVKYLKQKKAVAGIGEIISGRLIVVPVPLSRKRLNWRGFNQAELIGAGITSELGWPCTPGALTRARGAKPQADLADHASRVANMQGVFVCKQPELVRGKTVLLIDDVSTTGATLDACARALKGAGTAEVIAFVFARNKLD